MQCDPLYPIFVYWEVLEVARIRVTGTSRVSCASHASQFDAREIKDSRTHLEFR